MLTKTLAVAAIALGASVMASLPANASPGYATGRLEVRAGPDYDYPSVGFARPGTRLEINGCLPDWSWCDVTTRRDRGWVPARDVQAEHRGRRLMYGAAWNVPTFQFSFGSYWDNHYRGRPFYRERVRWERHWHDHDRRGEHRGRGNDRRGRDNDHRGRDNDHRGRDNDHRDHRGHDNDRRGDGDWRDRRN